MDVGYVEWLYNKGDLTQHFNGWQFFRNSQWFFPIGLMDTATYPDKVSLIYSDAIPLFALPFKLLSSLLPEVFQYFGLWGLCCYVLQGIVAAAILHKYCINSAALVLSVGMFTFAPWMMQRLYMHTSLAAHWIILLGILLCMKAKKLGIWKNVAYWSLLLMTAAMVHIYFIPMCAVLLGVSALYRMCLERKTLSRVAFILITSFIPLIVAYLVLWGLGAFYGQVQYAKDALGEGSANLNFLFNSVGKSAFFPELPNPLAKWKEESFGYLGLGGFLLAVCSLVYMIRVKSKFEKIKQYKLELALVLLVLLIFLWLATSPVVAWNNHVLFRWLLLPQVYWVLNVFRSLGRFVWPICYILLLLFVISINTSLKCRRKICVILLLGAALCLQIADFKDFFRERSSWVNSTEGYPEFNRELWDSFTSDYEHIYVFSLANWQELGSYAAERKLTINETYLARRDEALIMAHNAETARNMQQGIADEKTLYILPSELGTKELQSLDKLYLYQIGNINVATIRPLPVDKQYEIAN